MKKVIFICKSFAPNNSVAAVRPTKLGKYLCKTGKYEIDVLKLQTFGGIDDELLKKDLSFVREYHEIPQIHRQARAYYAEQNESMFSVIKRKCESLIEYVQEWIHTQRNYFMAKQYIRKNLLDYDYDVILSSSGPFLTHMIAKEMKKKCNNAIWVADYRDPVPTTIVDNKMVKLLSRKNVKNVTQNADIVMGATTGCYENMEIYSSKKCYEITNGYDMEDVQEVPMDPPSRFTLSYTGTIHRQKSDVSMVFKALEELIADDVIEEDKISIRYAGRMEKEFLRQAEQYSLQNVVQSSGYVGRNEALKLQLESHILLLASFNYKHQNDVVTGKFYEYLMNRKPIICTIMGDAADSRLKRIIKAIDCGVCWEEANSQEDYIKLKNYLRMQYNNYITKGNVEYKIHENEIEKYNYCYIVKQLDEIIEKFSKGKKKGTKA